MAPSTPNRDSSNELMKEKIDESCNTCEYLIVRPKIVI